MDLQDQEKKVEALEAIKARALDMAGQGADSFEVRDFITDAKKELAYELPDTEAFEKAARAAGRAKSLRLTLPPRNLKFRRKQHQYPLIPPNHKEIVKFSSPYR